MKLEMCLFLLTTSMAVMSSNVSAQSSICTNVLISMAPCLEYITRNTSSPSQQCCSQFAHVVQSSPACLCEVLNGTGGSQFGIKVNETQALTLPKACNVQTPPSSRCHEHGNVTKTVQGEKSSSDGSSIKFSLLPLLAIFFTASYINILDSVLSRN